MESVKTTLQIGRKPDLAVHAYLLFHPANFCEETYVLEKYRSSLYLSTVRQI